MGPCSAAQESPPDQSAAPAGRFALEFDGQSSFVWLGQPFPDQIADGTLELWFRLLRPWNGRSEVPLIGDDRQSFGLVLRDGRLFFTKQFGSQTDAVLLDLTGLDTGWHHVAAVWGSKGLGLFWDGKLKGQRPEKNPYQRWNPPFEQDSPSGTRLGMAAGFARDSPYRFFEGQIAGVRVCSRRLYEADFVPSWDWPANPPSDRFRFDCAEGGGRVLHDSSGRGRHGLIAGCVWRPLERPSAPRAADAPSPQTPPVVLVPFSCAAPMLVEGPQIHGFHLTAAWVLNYLGKLSVMTNEQVQELVPDAAFPHRRQLNRALLENLVKARAAAAVISGNIEPAPGSKTEDRQAAARVTVTLLRPGRPPWQKVIELAAQSDAEYTAAQLKLATLLYEELVAEPDRVPLRGSAAGKAPDELEARIKSVEQLLLRQDTYSLLQAADESHRLHQDQPLRGAAWRLLAESYAWLGASLAPWPNSLEIEFFSRARAAQNLALLLDGPNPENTLNLALLRRLSADLLEAQETAATLQQSELNPRQRAILALVTGQQKLIPADRSPDPFYALLRGRVYRLNGQSVEGIAAYEEAWQHNRLATSIPGLVVEASGVVKHREVAPLTPQPGLLQGYRLLAWSAREATGDAKLARKYLRRTAAVTERRLPNIADDASPADPDQAVRAIIADFDQPEVQPDERLSSLLWAFRDFEHAVADELRRAQSPVHAPGQAAAIGPPLVRQLARIEAQSGFDNLMTLWTISLGVVEEAHQLLVQLIEVFGYDAMTADWAVRFLTQYKLYRDKVPWPPELPRFAPAFQSGYGHWASLTRQQTHDLYRRALERFPRWDVPWTYLKLGDGYRQNPFDGRNARLWVHQAEGPERHERLEQALAAAPESLSVRHALAELLLRDYSLRDAERGLEMYRAVIEQSPQTASFYHGLADYYVDAGQPERAIEQLNRFIATEPESLAPVFAMLRMAEIHAARQEHDKELGVLETAAASYQAAALLRYAQALARAGRIDEAVQVFDAQSERYPPGVSAQAAKAIALHDAGRVDEARRIIQRLVQSVPYQTHNRAVRDYVETTQDHALALQLQRQLESGLAGKLVLARSALELGQIDAALATSRQAMNAGPSVQEDVYFEELANLRAYTVGRKYLELRQGGNADEAGRMIASFAVEPLMELRTAGPLPPDVPRGQMYLASLLAAVAGDQAGAWARPGRGRPIQSRSSAKPAGTQNKSPAARAEGEPATPAAPAAAAEKLATIDRAKLLGETLATLGKLGEPAGAGGELARVLGACEPAHPLLQSHLSGETYPLLHAQDRLRLAARQVLRQGLVSGDEAKSLASALLRLRPAGVVQEACPSQLAALFARAGGAAAQQEFQAQAGELKLSDEERELYQRAGHSWADFYLLGPLPDRRLDGIHLPFLDEIQPVDLDAALSHQGQEFDWQRPLEGQTWGGVSLTVELKAPWAASVFYAVRKIQVPEATRWRLLLSGPQSAKVYLNQRIVTHWIHTKDLSEDLQCELPLTAGENTLLLKLRYGASRSKALWCQFPDEPSPRPAE